MNKKLSEIEFDNSSITNCEIVLENGVSIKIAPINIQKCIISCPHVGNNNIQIHHIEKEVPVTTIELHDVEMKLVLKPKANVVYHGYDNYTCRYKVFDRLKKNDIVCMKIFGYNDIIKKQFAYAIYLKYSDTEWCGANLYQQSVVRAGMLYITVQEDRSSLYE